MSCWSPPPPKFRTDLDMFVDSRKEQGERLNISAGRGMVVGQSIGGDGEVMGLSL